MSEKPHLPLGDPLYVQQPLSGMYRDFFLDYASYVILERAIPAAEDGLKPVQRRILHAMYEMNDGRFNKVANIIGQSMQFHPHGDASIGEALVLMGQKELLLETQGNWGDLRTGDEAAAARYIEARLSGFALDVVFNPKTTSWQLSYDGRKNEPLTLPVKFPLLLAQGADGIAVGLSTKILPHNFRELIEASIKCLQGKKFELFPDFPTGGMCDISGYNEGRRGSRIRVRARIEELDKKTLVIRDVPFGITTLQLMDSIVKASENGKIRIKKVVDNTAKEVEIQVQLAPGISPDITTDALYAFTDCEVSLSPNACVIMEDKPRFVGVNDLLHHAADHTRELLNQELKIYLKELEEDWHYSSLEKIFIEKRIYRRIEDAETWQEVLDEIDRGLHPYKVKLKREVVPDDLVKLTEIRIKRISRFDSKKADEHIAEIEEKISQMSHHLSHLTEYTIDYFEKLLKKYGKGRERRTQIRNFETIQASAVAMANTRLYVNKIEGFVGTSLKKDEFAFECSDLDQVIIIRRDGKMMVTRVSEKAFVGKDIIHLDIFRKNDERTTYNLIYSDTGTGISYAKRFQVTGVTMDREYPLGKGEKCRVHYLTANPNGEAERVTVNLHPSSSARKKILDFDFSELEIRSRSSTGNQLTRFPVKSVKLKEKGSSTLSGIQIWFDSEVGRLNTEGRGASLGSFHLDDRIIAFYRDGSYELTGYELTNRYESAGVLQIGKFDPKLIVSAVYFDGEKKQYNVKRFRIETLTLNNKFPFIREDIASRLVLVTIQPNPVIRLVTGKKRSDAKKQVIHLGKFVEVMGWKAIGNRLCGNDLQNIELVSPTTQAPGNTQGELF
ncbi:MAG TPA: DNA gyrase/topoisomerase IV subunit A [Chitinophagaceae bacterium]|nr:DNA gyrase/topoisomerase IV subunit A [Chitinophagaceae bacterium]